MSLDLSPELENVVRERAAAEGVSVNDLLARAFAPEMMQTPPITESLAHVRALLALWRAQDHTSILPAIPTQTGETPTQALFRRWEEEDAVMTEEAQAKQAMFWEEFQQSVNTERTSAGMRALF